MKSELCSYRGCTALADVTVYRGRDSKGKAIKARYCKGHYDTLDDFGCFTDSEKESVFTVEERESVETAD